MGVDFSTRWVEEVALTVQGAFGVENFSQDDPKLVGVAEEELDAAWWRVWPDIYRDCQGRLEVEGMETNVDFDPWDA